MKKLLTPLSLMLIILTASCSILGGNDKMDDMDDAVESQELCGDGVCDGPENINNCPEDCSAGQTNATEESSMSGDEAPSELSILYHLTKHSITINQMDGEDCYLFNFQEFLDAGLIHADGTNNQILLLKDYPTSLVTSKYYDRFFYISSMENPVQQQFGFSFFNWDVDNQVLRAASFSDQISIELTPQTSNPFPGGVTTSPENEFLLYPMTQKTSTDSQMTGMISGKMNPFSNDSSLIITRLDQNVSREILSNSYNRQLFNSFADFSTDGHRFFTISREGEQFQFVQVDLQNGSITRFDEVYPGFDWAGLNWNEFFPPSEDFSYAVFTISPDETRLIAYKNIFTAALDNPCFSQANHHLWVFNLETNQLISDENRIGYVSDTSWNSNNNQLAVAVVGNSGCYPDYLDSRITLLDKEGNILTTLVEELKNKITSLGWSPGGDWIAYDTYSTDHIGRLKVIVLSSTDILEIINTQELGYDVGSDNPVIITFADWVSGCP